MNESNIKSSAKSLAYDSIVKFTTSIEYGLTKVAIKKKGNDKTN